MSAPKSGKDHDRPRWRRASVRDRERASLDLERIVGAAVAIADEQGADAVTMRSVAARLGVGVMSLYWYVPTKSDLEGQIALRIMDEATEDIRPTGNWRADLTAFARSCRQAMLRHPWIIDWVGKVGVTDQPDVLAAKHRHMERLMRLAESLPVSATEGRDILLMIDDASHGFALWEIIKRRQVEMMAAGDEPNEPVHSAGVDPAARPEETADYDRSFEQVLQTLLDGIEARLARAAKVDDDSVD